MYTFQKTKCNTSPDINEFHKKKWLLKGIFPNDCFDNQDRLQEAQVPKQTVFHSTLMNS